MDEFQERDDQNLILHVLRPDYVCQMTFRRGCSCMCLLDRLGRCKSGTTRRLLLRQLLLLATWKERSARVKRRWVTVGGGRCCLLRGSSADQQLLARKYFLTRRHRTPLYSAAAAAAAAAPSFILHPASLPSTRPARSPSPRGSRPAGGARGSDGRGGGSCR